MTSLLPDVVTCDLCGAPTCRRCQPDSISVCADEATVHCAEHPCRPCQAAAADEYREGVQADIALTDCEATT